MISISRQYKNESLQATGLKRQWPPLFLLFVLTKIHLPHQLSSINLGFLQPNFICAVSK